MRGAALLSVTVVVGIRSVLLFLIVAAAAALVVAIVQTRRLSRSASQSTSVDASALGDHVEIACGFRGRIPSLLSVSYPLARVIVARDALVLRGPTGDFVFERSSGAALERMRRTLLFHRVRLIAGDRSAVVYLRDPGALRAALADLGWSEAIV
jgi:hypothetical protein